MPARFFPVLIFTLLVGLTAVTAQPECSQTQGLVTRETYYSAILGQNMFYSVYTPPCYETSSASYPTLYLMHGSNEDDGHWQRLNITEHLDSGISSGELPAMIVVMPFGNVIANRNRFDQVSWGNIFTEELMPDAESQYRIDTSQRRAIGGISRGGFWAFSIGLRHPELFSTIGGHSGFFDLYHAPDDYNPLALIQSVPEAADMRFYIDRGADDFAFEGLDIMGERMAERGLNYQYVLRPEGIHYNTYWIEHVAEYLQFYAGAWAQTAEPAPTRSDTTQAPSAFATNTPPVIVSTVASPTPSPVVTVNSGAFTTATPSQPFRVQATAVATRGIDLYVPTVSFPSLQTNISAAQMAAIASGQHDPALIVGQQTAAELSAHGISLHPDTTIMADADIADVLWRSRERYALLPFDQVNLRQRMLWIDEMPVVDVLDDYPLAFADTDPNFIPSQLTRVTLSGVTALTRQMIPALDANGIEWAGDGIRDYVTRSDFFHISNEVSFAPNCPQMPGDALGGPTSFCSKREHFDLLSYLDVDIVELSGNHNNDFGYDAYRDTLAFYIEHDMQPLGGGETLADARRPVIQEHNGSTIAMLACNQPGPYYALVNEDPTLAGGLRPGAASCDEAWLQETIPALAIAYDTVIVTVQQPEIEDYLPSDDQIRSFRRIAELGADIVAGTAAHKPQTFEFYSRGDGGIAYIHYGMGNLFFDQPFWGNTRFFMNTALVYDGQLLTIDLFPGIIDDLARPRLMTADERLNFLHFMFVQQTGF